MRVIIPSSYGFCDGVRSALEKAERAASSAKKEAVFLYGSIVHNSLVTAHFENLGVKVISSPDEVDEGTVIIRTHGIGDSERKKLLDKGLSIVDATCPVVLCNMAKLRKAEGNVLIIGKHGHSEITTLKGVRPDAIVIESPDDLLLLEKKKYSAALQTTLSLTLLDSILKRAESLGIEIETLNTICNASLTRREALCAIINNVEAVVIVGDGESANSRELKELASSLGRPSYLVLTPEELPPEIAAYSVVGLSAGASTPDEAFEAMRAYLTKL